MKQCNKCKEWKNESEFYKHKRMKDGLSIYCRICMREMTNISRRSEQGREKIKEYNRSNSAKIAQKKYKQSSEGQQKRREYQKTEKFKIADGRYRQSPKGRDTIKKHLNSPEVKIKREHYRIENQDKIKARRAINNAIRDGKFPPARLHQCVDCKNRPAEQYHHYNGYEPKYWLDVVPLCAQCHANQHSNQKPPE